MEYKQSKKYETNIKKESPSLNAVIDNVQQPNVKKKYTKLENGNAARSSGDDEVNNQETGGNDNEEATSKNTSSVSAIIVSLLFVVALSYGGFVVYKRIFKRPKDDFKNNIKLQNRNTWDMNAIELKQRNKPKDYNDSGNSEETEKKNTFHLNPLQNRHLNPIRESAIGFAIEDQLPKPSLNKNSKPNRRSIMTIDNENEWIEYIDENMGKPYYHNVTTGETTWEAPDVLFQKA